MHVSHNDDEFLESYFNLLIRNIAPSNVAKILQSMGYRTLKDLKGVNPENLLSIKGVGNATIVKLNDYF